MPLLLPTFAALWLPAYLPLAMFPGLCSDCVHARVIENRRGSRFWLCARSRFDPRFRRYPPLPVIACAGFEARAADASTPVVMENENE